MRMRQEVGRGRPDVERGLIEIARDGEEAFGPKEPSRRDPRQPTGTKRLGEVIAHRFDRTEMIGCCVAFAASGWIVACKRRDPFKQGRLSGSVLTQDDCDRVFELKFEIGAKKRQGEWNLACFIHHSWPKRRGGMKTSEPGLNDNFPDAPASHDPRARLTNEPK